MRHLRILWDKFSGGKGLRETIGMLIFSAVYFVLFAGLIGGWGFSIYSLFKIASRYDSWGDSGLVYSLLAYTLAFILIGVGIWGVIHIIKGKQ